ncbi:MAG TPA: IPT/TIG domain-containing protein [Polyangiaceae bacterium]
MALSIQSITPASGPVAGATTVTITVSGCSRGSAPTVTFGGAPATGVSLSADGGTITAKTPAQPAGPADVVVTTSADGSATSSGGFYFGFGITSVEPVQGPLGGGTTVTITTVGCSPGTAPTVTFGGVKATKVSVSGSTVTATTPAGSVGPVDVVVSDGTQGSATSAAGYCFYTTPDVEVGTKYLQLYVPEFGTAPYLPPQVDGAGSPTHPMSSFMRIGMPIAGTTSLFGDPVSTYGDQLLQIGWNSSPSSSGNGVYDAASTAAGNVAAIADDCTAIATAVTTAVASTVASYPGNTSTYSPNVAAIAATTNAVYQAAGGASGGSTALQAAQSAVVTASLSPFVDDTRDQGASNNANGLTVAQRVSESALLFTKGGWRDHTDGNRVTTTFGDKIEVIRGNYKLIVLGRQDAAGGGHTWESSGGCLQDNDAPPGQITEYKYVETQDGTWRTIETTSKGDVETIYDGKVVDRFVAGSISTIVGREDKATSTGPIGTNALAQLKAEFALDQQTDTYVDAALTFDAYLTQRGYNKGTGTQSQDYFHEESGGSNPVVFEQTWASRMESYVGSSAAWVPDIIDATYATNITETVNATTLTTTLNAATLTETRAASGTLSENHSAATFTENWDVSGSMTSNTTTGGSINETTTVAGTVTDTLNATDSIFAIEKTPATAWTLTFATVSCDVNIGVKWEASIGAHFETNVGPGIALQVGPNLEIATAITLSVHAVEVAFTKLKYENDAIEFKDIETKGKQGAFQITMTALGILL